MNPSVPNPHHALPIGLVEDEPVLREELVFQLDRRGFKMAAFADAIGLYRHMAIQPLAAVVLDVGLPGEDGLSIARLLRSHNPHIGIIMLTARSARSDKLDGLEAGADAYLVKPVDVDELDLILHRLLQRHASATLAPGNHNPNDQSTKSEEEQWKLSTTRAVLLAPNGSTVKLTLTEFQLLTELVSKKGKPCRPLDLARALGMMPDEWDRHRLEVIVSRLRQKIERNTGATAPISTVRGTGYTWDPFV